MIRLMKMCVFVVGILTLLSQFAEAIDKRYQIKSGRIEYSYDGSGGFGVQKGTEVLEWVNFGSKEKRVTDMTTKVMGITQQSKSINVIDGEYSYSYDPDTHTAMRMKFTDVLNKKDQREINKFQVMSEKLVEDMGGVKQGTEKVLGKTCTNYFMEAWGTTVCLYKSVPLLTRINVMGMNIVMTATSFDENAKVNAADLALPANAQISEAAEMMRTAEMPDAESMTEAMEMMKEMQNTMKGSAEYQEFLEMKRQQQIAEQAQNVDQGAVDQKSDGFTQAAVEAAESGVKQGVQDSVRSETRRGVRKAIGGAFKSLF